MGQFQTQIETLRASKMAINGALTDKLSEDTNVGLSEVPEKIREIETAKYGTLNITWTGHTMTCNLGYKTVMVEGGEQEFDDVPPGHINLTFTRLASDGSELREVYKTINNGQEERLSNTSSSFTDSLEISAGQTISVEYRTRWFNVI